MREALKISIDEMKLRLALELYRRGSVSFGRMAELTGLGYRENKRGHRANNVKKNAFTHKILQQ